MRHPARMTIDEFFTWDALQPETERYEFLNGEILSFGQGATLDHNTLVGRLFIAVAAGVRPPCRALVGMQRIVSATSATFPDIVVLCDERDLRAEDRSRSRYPKLVVEVLLPSTASYDLLVKRRVFEQISTVEEYLVVDSRSRDALVYRRRGDRLDEAKRVSSGMLALASLPIAIDIDDLYLGIEIAPM